MLSWHGGSSKTRTRKVEAGGAGLGDVPFSSDAGSFGGEAITAVVHFLNNLFKLVLVGRHANIRIAVRFGIPAIGAAFGGAFVLVWLTGQEPL